jgi:hypothetical protein
MNLNLLFSKIGISQSLAQDATLLLLIVLASFVLGIFIGRYKLITVLISIYVSLAVLAVVPEGYLADYTYRLGFFAVAVIVMTLTGKKVFDAYISGTGFMWRVFAMSFIEVAMLISITLSIIPKKIALSYVSQNAYYYLASENARFIWLVIPLVFIFIIHKKLNR